MVRIISQRQPQHLVGLSFVVLLHVLIIYAFLNGLASRPTSDAPPPLLVRLMTPERSPATEKPSVKPKLEEAPLVRLTVPEVISTRPPLPPTTPIINGPPIGPVLIGETGTSRPIDGTDVSGITPARTAGPGDCSNAASLASLIEYPARARRLGIYQGQVNVEFSVAAGGAMAIEHVSASNAMFESAALNAIMKLHCSAGHYRLPISFVLQD